MSERNQSNLGSTILILIVLALAAFWYFGRTCPIEVRIRSVQVPCAVCQGAKTIDCPACGGFGSVDSMGICGKCKGTGRISTKLKLKSEVRCPACRGTGRAEIRAPCTACEGNKTIPCPACKGTGTTSSSSAARSKLVVMGSSPWERLLSFLKLPIAQNPCPQQDDQGGYPIVDRYIYLRSDQRAGQVEEWGEFKQVGYPWKMTAKVGFVNQAGQPFVRSMEFTVRDRALESCRTIH